MYHQQLCHYKHKMTFIVDLGMYFINIFFQVTFSVYQYHYSFTYLY